MTIDVAVVGLNRISQCVVASMNDHNNMRNSNLNFYTFCNGK